MIEEGKNPMKKKLWFMFVVTILIIIIISGCFEKNEEANDQGFEGITLESDIAELVYATKEFIKNDDGETIRVEVRFRFRNIAGRDIDFNVTAEFYDEDNNLLETSPKKWFILLEGYTEVGIGPANIISYEGEDLTEVDHVILRTVEGET